MDGLLSLIELSALTAGRGRRVCKAGLDVAVFRIGDAVYAIDDSCPHAGGSLANGKVEGKRVTCPAHGMKFDLDHVCRPGLPTLQARKYAVHVVDGMVMLARGTPPQQETTVKETS
jgi:3-phenylpropionate/trans-cinnamate dioxygenase ferredoxin subunit